MTLFIGTITGGNKGYDVSQMRPIHYGLNITDFHFDAALENFTQALVEHEVPRSAISAVIKLVQAVRVDVTSGWTIRSEMAKQRNSSGGFSTFEALGGAVKFPVLIDELFNQLLADSRVKKFFQHKTELLKQSQLVYLSEFFGCENAFYKGRDLPSIHVSLGLTDYHFDAYVQNFEKAMTQLGFDSSLVDQAVVMLEPIRELTLSSRIEDAGDKHQAFKSKMKDGKQLIERVGGDANLEGLVDLMFEKLLADDRVRFFFEKSKQRFRQIRTRFFEFLSTIFRNGSTDDLPNLRATHDPMNITNYHFDCFASSLEAAAKEFGLEQDVIDDCLFVLNRARADITTGYTVRVELAKVELAVGNRQKLYAELTKNVSFETLIDRLYSSIPNDKRINLFFAGAKIHDLKKSQTLFIAGLLGGDKNAYKGRTLKEIHAVINVKDYHFDCFLQNFGNVLKDAEIEKYLIDQVYYCLEEIRNDVVRSKSDTNLSSSPFLQKFVSSSCVSTLPTRESALISSPKIFTLSFKIQP